MNGKRRAHRLEPWKPTEKERLSYTGRYFSDELETFYTVAIQDSQLVVQHRRFEDVTLVPVEENTFTGEWPVRELSFIRNEQGMISGLTVSNGRTRNVHFKKTGIKTVKR